MVEDCAERFDFHKEAAEIEPDMVQEMTIDVDPDNSGRATVILISLEG